MQTGLGSGGHAAGDTYRSIEDVYGSSYNDLLIGNGAFNEINGYRRRRRSPGGAGGDYLDGGDGVDTLDYRVDAGVNVNLGNGGTFGGDAQGDQFLAFESIFGSDFNDTLAGTRRRTGCSATRATTSASGWTETTPSRATTGTTRSTAASATTFASAARAPTS